MIYRVFPNYWPTITGSSFLKVTVVSSDSRINESCSLVYVFLWLWELLWCSWSWGSTPGACEDHVHGERGWYFCSAQQWPQLVLWCDSETVELLRSIASREYLLCFYLWLLYWLLSGLRICFHVREVSPSLLHQIKVSETVPKSRLCEVEDVLR